VAYLTAVEPEKIKQSQGQIILHKHGTWSGARADLVRRADLKRQEIDLSTDKHSIFLNIRGVAKFGENYIDGRKVGFAARTEGSLTYIPPDCAWSGWDEGDASACYLMISVEKEFLANLFDRLSSTGNLRPKLGFRDLPIQCAARQIASELVHDDIVSELIVEGYLVSLFGHLLRRSGVAGKTSRGGLAPAVLKRMVERIEAHVDRPIRVRELAEEAGVSFEHFCRAFKQSVGLTPYTFFNQRRLERASDLLRTTSLSVTEVALACGYASGSHLSTRFRRETGFSPVKYRAVWTD
jgi:AraC-like DNA-binding protein